TRSLPLNVRSSPSLSASVIDSLPTGTVVSTTGRTSGGWVELANRAPEPVIPIPT
ncbi:MAG: SH3 domain-containing protein, partial [Cyanothece sp. SIO1E1]|nr:SH3 domain-containing protein [Cyanothece sp. SIO1E1]